MEEGLNGKGGEQKISDRTWFSLIEDGKFDLDLFVVCMYMYMYMSCHCRTVDGSKIWRYSTDIDLTVGKWRRVYCFTSEFRMS